MLIRALVLVLALAVPVVTSTVFAATRLKGAPEPTDAGS